MFFECKWKAYEKVTKVWIESNKSLNQNEGKKTIITVKRGYFDRFWEFF